jgi:serine protease Do
MKTKILLALLFSITCTAQLLPPIDQAAVAPVLALQKAFNTIAAHVQPAVVSVYTERNVRFRSPRSQYSREYNMQGLGSGMILDREGHVLTNNHVVGDMNRMRVRLANGEEYEARVVGTDPATDVAVIQMVGNYPKNLATLPLADSSDLKVGDFVLAVGAPFGLTQSVTQGIVSATGRNGVGITEYEDFIQTDAAINVGNSGGPLVNMRGEAVGLNTAIATAGGGQASSGVGFSIPSNLIKSMLPSLVKGQRISRGALGVMIQDVNNSIASQLKLPSPNGVLIAEVLPGSPAQRAGLQPGDVVTKIDDRNVANSSVLRNLVMTTKPGTQVKVEVIRQSRPRTLTVQVLERAPVN